MTLTTWWLFVVATLLIAATPGPNMLHIMTRGAEVGFRRTTIAMAGCLAANTLWVTASALGLGALLLASTALFEVLRYLGVAYLLWLGWKSWTAEVRVDDAAAGTVVERHEVSTWTLLRGGFLTASSNPKLIVFAAAFFPQFIRPDAPWVPQFAILVLTFAVIELCCFCAYASGGRQLARWLASAPRRRLFNRATGALFAGFGAALLAWRA